MSSHVGAAASRRVRSVRFVVGTVLIAIAGGLSAPRASESGAGTPVAQAAPTAPSASTERSAQVFVVSSEADTGPGSLRWAILDANQAANGATPDRITFAIAGDAPHTIRLASALPAITEAVGIDGLGAVAIEGNGAEAGLVVRCDGATIRGLTLRGFAGDALRLEGGGGHRLEGLTIGGDVAGGEGAPPANAGAGLAIVDSRDNTIGGADPAARNVITGNGGCGVRLSGAAATGNRILGNRIAGNRASGIALDGKAAARQVRPAAVPGTLDGPNRYAAEPALAQATRRANGATLIEGTLQAQPLTAYRVELFATPNKVPLAERSITEWSEGAPPTAGETAVREGERLVAVAAVTTDASGRAELGLLASAAIESRALLTATATDADGNTSEFSAPIRAPLVTKTWANAAGGNWNVAGNWSPSGVPLSGDDAVITLAGTYTVTLDTSPTVASLTLGGASGVQTLSLAAVQTITLSGASTVNASGVLAHSVGTIAGAGALTINGSYNWTSGAQTGAGVTTVNGALTIVGAGNHDLTSSRTLNTAATVTWSGTGVVRLGTGAVINNSGTWDCQTDSNLQNPFGGTATFNNGGTFRKSAGAGTTIVFNSLTAFHNTGTVRAQTGTISLRATGTHTGAFDGAGGTVEFSTSTHDLNAGTSWTGAVTLVSGTLNVNSALAVPQLNHSGGTLQGAATFTTTGLYTWSGGAMNGAGITNANGGLALTGGNMDVTGGRTLNVPAAATATWTGAGPVRLGTGGVINNAGTWDCQTDSNLQNPFGGAATFNNSGTFRKTAGTGASTVFNSLTAFHNTGTVRAQTGTISLRAPGTHTGAFVGTGSGTVEFSTSTHDLDAGTSFSGTVTLVSGALDVNAPLTVPQFTQSGGTLQGTAAFTTTGLYTWTAGTMTAAGTTNANGGLQLSGGTVDISGGRILSIPAAATATMSASAVVRIGTGAAINNAGTWDWQNDTNLQNPFGGAATFNNSGTFKKTAGTGVSTIFNSLTGFHNTGTVRAQTGTLSLRAPGTHTGTFNGAGGTVEFSTSTHDLNLGTSITGTATLVSGALNVNTPLTVPQFTQSGGTLQGTAAFTCSGVYTWTGGAMTAAGTTNANGGLQLTGGTVDVTGGRILNVPAAATATMGASTVVRLGTGGVINNGGTWDWQGDTNIQNPFGGNAVFNNAGTFKKTAGAGTAIVFNSLTGFHNTGTVSAQSGTISLRASGTHTGAFAGTGGTVEFSTSTHDLNPGTSITGTVTLVSGALNVNTPLTVPQFTQSGGTLQGTSPFTCSGVYTWSGGTMTAAGTTHANGGLVMTGGTVDVTGGRVLNTPANVTWGGVAVVRLGTGAVVNNGGTWDVQNDSSIQNPFGGSATFNNTGTFRKTAGTATTTVFSSVTSFHNTGTVAAQSGTIQLQPNGTHTGAFNATGGTIQFATGTHDLNAGTSFTGAVQLVSGVMNVNSALTAPQFAQSGGTLQGAAPLAIAGAFNWSGGTITAAGTVNANGGIAITGTAAHDVTGNRTLNAAGAITWSGTGPVRVGTGGVVNNGGTWDCQTDSSIQNPFGGAATFNNLAAGTFKKTAGAGTTTVSLPFTNAGAVQALAGTLTFSAAPTGYSQSAGSLTLNGGAVTSPNTMNITGGTVTGIGTVSASMSVAGATAPGLPLGTLNESGNYTQTAAGALNVELGGTTAGVNYDQFRVGGTGAAVLAGTLNVSLVNGFVPAAGNTFTVMTYASRSGTFNTVTPFGGGCIGWTTRYDPTAVVLTAVLLPIEIDGQLVATDKKTLSWAAAPSYPGTTYDVLRGQLPGGLPVGASPGTESCVATGLAATQATDATNPALGKAFWYLVREKVAGCGTGTYGQATSGATRISATCP